MSGGGVVVGKNDIYGRNMYVIHGGGWRNKILNIYYTKQIKGLINAVWTDLRRNFSYLRNMTILRISFLWCRESSLDRNFLL